MDRCFFSLNRPRPVKIAAERLIAASEFTVKPEPDLVILCSQANVFITLDLVVPSEVMISISA